MTVRRPATANAVAPPPLADVRDQRRHGFTPGVLIGDLEDRLVGDDLCSPFRKREVDQDSRPARRPSCRRGLKGRDGAAAHAPVLGRARS